MSDSNAVLALKLLSAFQEVQHRIDELVDRKFAKLGAFGKWNAGRTKHLTDEERRAAFLAIAADAGLDKQVKHVPNVLGDAAAIRNRLAHSMTLGPEPDGVRGFKDGEIFRVSAAELELAVRRLFWALEHVLHVGEVAGIGAADPFDILRRSGIRLIDSPPAAQPPSKAIVDPSRVPRFDLRYAQMRDREARREVQASEQLDSDR